MTFFLIQSLEVSIEGKRSTDDNLPMQTPKWKLGGADQAFEVKYKKASEHDRPAVTKDNPGIINKDATSEKYQKKIMFFTANYERFPLEANLKGPGAGGDGVTVDPSRKDDEDEGFSQHSFNRVASDMISVHRKLRDYRNKR